MTGGLAVARGNDDIFLPASVMQGGPNVEASIILGNLQNNGGIGGCCLATDGTGPVFISSLALMALPGFQQGISAARHISCFVSLGIEYGPDGLS